MKYILNFTLQIKSRGYIAKKGVVKLRGKWLIVIFLFILIGVTNFIAFQLSKKEMDRKDIKIELKLNDEIIELKESVEGYDKEVRMLREQNDVLYEKYYNLKNEIEDIDNKSVKQNGVELDSNVNESYVKISIDEKNKISRELTELDNLTWVIVYNGDIVLERNAEDETQYKYFSEEPGIYTVYLKAWIDGGYKTVSNVISYELKN